MNILDKIENGFELAELVFAAGKGVVRAFQKGDLQKEEFVRYVELGSPKNDSAEDRILDENLDKLREDFRSER